MIHPSTIPPIDELSTRVPSARTSIPTVVRRTTPVPAPTLRPPRGHPDRRRRPRDHRDRSRPDRGRAARTEAGDSPRRGGRTKAAAVPIPGGGGPPPFRFPGRESPEAISGANQAVARLRLQATPRPARVMRPAIATEEGSGTTALISV